MVFTRSMKRALEPVPQASSDSDTSDDEFQPDSESEEESGAPGATEGADQGAEAGDASREISAAAGDHDDDDDDDDDEGGDYDDGMEEEDSNASGADVRRPVSIQEFLAWRLLGRVPRGSHSIDDKRPRYPAYEEAVPQALTRGSLWQQITQATGAAGQARRNSAAHFDSCLDVSVDASLLSNRTAPYGKRVRQAVREAFTADPRVAAYVSMLGPHLPTTSSNTTSTAADGAVPPPDAPTGSAAPAPAPAPPPAPSTPATPPGATAPSTVVESSGPAAATPAAAAATATPDSCGGGGGSAPAGGAAATASGSWPAAAAAAAEGTAAAAAAVPGPVPAGYLSGSPVVPSPRMVLRREQGEAAGPGRGWSAPQVRHMQCYRGMPRYPRAVVDSLDSRAYIGQFSADGQFFVAAFQDRRVRLYDVERNWRLRKDITTRMCRWTITDTSISPDQRFVIYSSIIPVVHLVEVGSQYDGVSSIANITQVHEALNFDDTTSAEGADFRLGRSFGIWSVQWSGDGREIVAGTNDQSVVVMDAESRRVVARAEGHEDDVNAVTYADCSPNIIISGSDDTFIKVWDRRTMPGTGAASARRHRPAGVLVGHTEGLTHLHSRGDGLHVLSNAKDQTAKLWDIRMMQAGGSLRDAASAAKLSRCHVPQFNWDYRWQEYPAAGRVVRHPHDTSVQTYRGHTVQHTLIRAYFSPAHTTGQRFVYTGSVEGGVHVYDMVSGQEVEGSPFRLHRKLVRDVSWHPFEPVMATVSWDGTVVRWDAVPPDSRDDAPVVPGHDAYNDYY